MYVRFLTHIVSVMVSTPLIGVYIKYGREGEGISREDTTIF
jgi:hypothetical protein